jgi:hypothetical protein
MTGLCISLPQQVAWGGVGWGGASNVKHFLSAAFSNLISIGVIVRVKEEMYSEMV